MRLVDMDYFGYLMMEFLTFRYYSDNSGTGIGSGIDKDFTSYYNTWVHLATTFDGSTYRAFLNGELIGTILSTTEVVALNRLTIGAILTLQ